MLPQCNILCIIWLLMLHIQQGTTPFAELCFSCTQTFGTWLGQKVANSKLLLLFIKSKLRNHPGSKISYTNSLCLSKVILMEKIGYLKKLLQGCENQLLPRILILKLCFKNKVQNKMLTQTAAAQWIQRIQIFQFFFILPKTWIYCIWLINTETKCYGSNLAESREISCLLSLTTSGFYTYSPMQSLEPAHEYQICQSVVISFILVGPMNNGETSAKLIALRKEETFFQQLLGLGIPFRNMKSMFKFICEEIWISFSDILRQTLRHQILVWEEFTTLSSLNFGQNTRICCFGYFIDLKLL